MNSKIMPLLLGAAIAIVGSMMLILANANVYDITGGVLVAIGMVIEMVALFRLAS